MLVVLALFDLLGLVAGFLLLRGGERAPGRELLRGFGLAATLVAACVVLGKLHWSDFVILRLLCHALFCVLAPLALWRGLVHRGVVGWSLVLVALAAEGCYVWARRIEPQRLEVTHHRVESERLAGRTRALRVAVLADLQTDRIGPFEERVFAALAAERPDLLLVTGDLLQTGSRPLDEVLLERRRLNELFARLDPPPRLGMWFVKGDCDARGDVFPGSGLRYLEDQAVVLEGEGVQLVGLSLGASRRSVPAELAARIRAFEGLSLVFAHAPDFALTLGELDTPVLALAGHTHGGQVQLPWFGPPLVLSNIPREIGGGGLFSLGASWLCVSRGIGMERNHAPRIRFLCRPELTLLELAPPTEESAAPSSRP